ncbi:malonate--CoA ligase [Lichenibacterium dinghuense]|uniref:malonate--CoA ligase n=1 Tax=Lichenibacterium dinghuense TaxID=2895977 RepID=UPI001F250C0A|nr:malonyl-CoA synthase [Lichenibacterium sp. 6Y81]
MPNHLVAGLRARAPHPDRRAIETAAGRVLSYRDLDALSGRIARALGALGVRPGDRVAAQVEKSVEALALYLATVRAGAVYLPLNMAYTPGELGYFASDAAPRLLVVDPARRVTLAGLAGGEAGTRIETLGAAGDGTLMALAAGEPPDFADAERGPGDLAAILYTSGTTGRSKGAMLTHDNLLSNALTLAELWRFTAEDVLLHALPVFHTHGLFVATNTLLAAGGAILFLPRFDPAEVLRLLPRATAMMGVPTFYTRLLAEPGLEAAARRLRLVVSGSAPLLADTHAAFRARTGHAILERYGMTETNMTTSNPYDGPRVPGRVGPPLPGVEVRVVDPASGGPLGLGETGMVEIRGPNVFAGYWRNPEKTAAEFTADGWFVSGDLGQFDGTGSLAIVGRAKDLVITGGYNVYPKEVEEAIDALPGVVESAVIGLPDADLGEAVTAVVVRAREGGPDAEAVLGALAGRLARFKQPRRVVFVDELPRNAMGKVQKAALRAHFTP